MRGPNIHHKQTNTTQEKSKKNEGFGVNDLTSTHFPQGKHEVVLVQSKNRL